MTSEPDDKLKNKDDGYVFVCYSHSDQEIVDSEIEWLQGQGYSVWWDARIQGGAEWNDELAKRIQNCEWFLYFASPHSVQSQHCRNELNYAQQHGRRMVAVELEPTEIPAGLQLMLNARQFLFRHKTSPEEFHERLKGALTQQIEPDFVQHKPVQGAASQKSSSKKWMAWGVLAMVVLAALAAVVLRQPEPEVLDFSERDWVVVGNLENRTDDPQIGEALETSLRIALEQSQFASIIPEATIREAKQRMEMDPDAPLDRNAAIEVAQREDARASVVGNITQLGGGYTISVEVLDPTAGTTVWPGSVTAGSADDLLPAIDEISRQVRERLGESLSSIEASSLPLAKVTTPDLEALRLYSLAQKSVATGDWETGLVLLERALEIDPEFAMAHGKIAAVYIAWARRPALAFTHYELALQNPSRLTPREQIYIEASSAWLKQPADMRQSWKSMTVMFPNEAVGFNNLGEVLRRYFLDYEAAAPAYLQSSKLRAPWQYLAIYNVGQSMLALEKPAEALDAFQRSFAMEPNPVDYGMADAHTLLGQHDQALEFVAGANPNDAPHLTRSEQFFRLRSHANRGEIDKALELTFRMLANVDNPDQNSRVLTSRVALLESTSRDEDMRSALEAVIAIERQAMDQLPAEVNVSPALTRLAILVRIALRSGNQELAAAAMEGVRERLAGNGFPVDQALLELLEAEIDLGQGDAEAALAHTQRSMDHAELFQAHETLARIHEASENHAGRQEALAWMKNHHGLAFIEDIDWFYGQLFNILDRSRAVDALESSG